MKLIVVGNSGEFSSLTNEYLKRIKLNMIEIREADKEAEGENILKNIKDDFVIACDENGKDISSRKFAELLKEKEISGKNICFVIGGAYGLGENILERANLKLSLSKMTFPYKLARLILLEQIYRAYCTNKGINYQK